MTWMLALPEIVLAVAGLIILLVGVMPKRDAFFPCSMAVIGALVVAAVLVLGQSEGTAFMGQYVADGFSRFAKLLILLGAALGLVLALDFNEKEKLARFEFPVLVLFATLGMMVMVSANDLMSLYIGLELLSLSSMSSPPSTATTNAVPRPGLKYFVPRRARLGLLLYGSSLVYGFAGTTNFDRLADALWAAVSGQAWWSGWSSCSQGSPSRSRRALPHVDARRVRGAPTPVTAFFASAPKVAAVALLMRVLIGPFGDMAPQWQQVIWVTSVGSMILGAFAATGRATSSG
jgi:NADH-quinone oxidoreductase subunit N